MPFNLKLEIVIILLGINSYMLNIITYLKILFITILYITFI